MRRVATVTVAGALGAALLGACTAEEKSAEPTRIDSGPTTYFAVPEDWYARNHAIEVGDDAVPVAWASNVPFEAADISESDATGPTTTIRNLPPHGIVIVAVGPRAGNVDFPQRGFPLSMADGSFLANEYEGQPAPHVSFGYIDTRVGDDILNVSYYLGTNEPNAQMRAQVDMILATLNVERADIANPPS